VFVLEELELNLFLVCFRMKIIILSAPQAEFLFEGSNIRDVAWIVKLVLFVVQLLSQLVVSCFYLFQDSFVALL